MKRINWIALAVFGVLLLVVFSLPPRFTRQVQASALDLISPFLRTGSALQEYITGVTEGLQTLEELQSDNLRLTVENRRLRVEAQLLGDLAQENERLRRALDYRERAAFELLPARVISRDATTWWSTVRIDRGREDGVRPDMAVLTEEGLVGKTSTVGSNTAVVILLADENCRVAASIQGSREQGILMGERASTEARARLILRFLTRDADLEPGQLVYSSGVGGVFPPGISLGRVVEFTPQELDGIARVTPAVDFSTLEDLFVVLDAP